MTTSTNLKHYTLILASVGISVCSLALPVAQEPSGEARKVPQREVVIPGDLEFFTVTKNRVVRITGKGIAGSRITASIDGPAEIIAENSITSVRQGQVLIGTGNREFEIQPTEAGTVEVVITTTPPQPNATPIEAVYRFDVVED